MKATLLRGVEQQVGSLKAEVELLTSGDIERQERRDGGSWNDCSRAEVHRLNNMISTLEALALLMRDPPPGLFNG